MKRITIFLLALMACITFANAEIIERVQIGDLYYNLDETNQTAEVTYQKQYSDANYQGLISVIIPNSLEYESVNYTITGIASDAFYGCKTLKTIVVPSSIASIGRRAFYSCRDLESIIVESNNAIYDSRNNCNAIIETATNTLVVGCMNTNIPNTVTSIGEYAFAACSKLTSIELPNSITSIGLYAFMFCSTLTSITIPNSVTNIEQGVFQECSALRSVTIENGVPKIGHSMFYKCANLESVNIPTSVVSIDAWAFRDCVSLLNLTIPNSVTSIKIMAFYRVPNVIYFGNATGAPWGAKSINGYIDDWLVYSDNTKTNLLGCSAVASGTLNIPNSVIRIGDEAFLGCNELTTILLPNSITSIGYGAFEECVGLTEISIPDGVSIIESRTFYHCENLLSINLPASLMTIRNGAFFQCRNLKSISCEATTPPSCDYEDEFMNVPLSARLYVPLTSISMYKSTSPWGKFTNIAPYGLYMVIFLDWNGAELKSIWVKQDSTATPPAIPTREGYTFIGWDKDFSNVTEDMTITAQYEINRYKVDFFDWDGALLKTDSVAYLTAAIAPETPTRTGYTFTGWDVDFAQITQDTTITALYDINYYLVVLLGHDGKLLSKQTVAYKHAAQQPEVPAREGYTFSGWSTDIESILDSTYAIALYDKIGGTVTYLSEEGDVIATENVDLHLPAAPIIAGKSFKGWLTESADSENGIVLRATYTSDNPTTSEDVTVTPSSNSADVTFPFITGALTYELVIRDLSGNVVCKIMFNSFGQLLGIAFAPSRNRNQQATQSTGFNFTVEGLNASTTYNYEFVAYDDTDDVIETLSGSFTTTADTPTNIDNAPAATAPQKYIQDGHLFIDNNNRTFDARGQQVR